MSFRVAFLALLVAGCGSGAGDQGATLRADVVVDANGTEATRIVAAASQIGLTNFDGAGQVVPGLASSWRIADNGLSVIFRLRPRTWPDGKPVTAGDVVASFRRAAQAGGRNPLRPLLVGFENGAQVVAGTRPTSALGIGAPVDNVVEIRLAGSMPTLLALLAEPEFAVTRAGPRPPPLGPFRVGDETKTPIALTRNPAAPPLRAASLAAIALTPVDDPGTAIARFARDRTDIVLGQGLTGFGDARLLAASNALRVEPSWGVYGYLANTTKGPLADARVRRALAMAIDRDDLGSRLFGVALPPVLGLVPPMPSQRIPVLPDWAINAPAARLELARQLLAAAGFSAASPLSVTISLPDAREHAMVAAEVAADWARIGVKTLTVARPDALHAQFIARGEYELALVERASGLDTPLAFLLPFTCAAKSGGYCNAGADALIAGAATTADPAAQSATLGLAEAAMVADTPLIPLFAPVRWALVAHRVSGWSSNAAGRHPLALLGIAPGQAAKP